MVGALDADWLSVRRRLATRGQAVRPEWDPPCGALRDNAVGPFDQTHGCILASGHEHRGEYAFEGRPYHVDATGRMFPAIGAKP